MSAGKMIKSKKSELQKKTNCPTFNESFHFKVPNGNLDAISASITIMQHAQAIKGSFAFVFCVLKLVLSNKVTQVLATTVESIALHKLSAYCKSLSWIT